ncbi:MULTISPECIES: DNA-processing protein DprA [Phyllobacteriaceae]|jgi:DNA processing protein|uniref:DNA protecting protein DprA n=1 Tax=Mesorhizobium hungaricum TaxID=1566387 RepID=A0A1C2DSV2_9HYPH|nr:MULTISPECIES: DNA-processing protein DprA [Mesorhizobium]MBN9236199.1 DNA-processing protein DprA [Mesorhizobium sp.]MDQ0327901.1 DNA processing protein [Mesorhizobium sp. YL-MeA3-2017]OCX17725.1 DNA protecting protein DprA [Mesorhizobium hungaricum]
MNSPVAGLHLSDRQRLNWLRLIRTPNVGPASFRDLINRFGSAETALEFLPELTLSGGANRLAKIPSIAEVEAEMETARRAGARFVCIGEPDYPPLLKRMDHPPPVLAIKGVGAVFALPTVAIVGARNASLAGIKMARMLAAELGREGYAIVSGLARGIDTAAHQGSLSTGTVAVLAGGLDHPYPPENLGLFEEITERGAVVSEMPFGWQPRAQDFPRRNRLVAGMAFGLIVVEAADRSGSLISARLAGEMGRLVFAVPGSPLDPRARGTNGLIKDGATLVTETADVLNALMPLVGGHATPTLPVEEPPDFSATPPPGDSERERVAETLGQTPVNIDEIIRHTGLHPAQVAMVLLELDLAGRLERHAGGSVSLIFID